MACLAPVPRKRKLSPSYSISPEHHISGMLPRQSRVVCEKSPRRAWGRHPQPSRTGSGWRTTGVKDVEEG